MEKSRAKGDWPKLAKACYDRGIAAMDRGDFNSAVLWMHRADTIYSAADGTFDSVSEKLMEDCSERIGMLEEAPLLYNDLPAEVEERAEEINDIQLRVWGLLSAARLVKLGERLGRLPGCGVLGRLCWAVDVVLKSFREPVSQEEYGQLMDVCNALYELGDSDAFYGGGEVDVIGGKPFQVFDLNGMGTLLELNGYLDNHLRLLSALSRDEEPPAAESGVVGCALLLDYYVRTREEKPEETPQVGAEVSRIWSDFDFIRSGAAWEQVVQKVAEYKALDIFQI